MRNRALPLLLAALLAPAPPAASQPAAPEPVYAGPWFVVTGADAPKAPAFDWVRLSCTALPKGGYGGCALIVQSRDTIGLEAAAAHLLANPAAIRPPPALTGPGLPVIVEVSFALNDHGGVVAQVSMAANGMAPPQRAPLPADVPPPPPKPLPPTMTVIGSGTGPLPPAEGPYPVEPRSPGSYAQTPRPSVITNPDWLTKPDGADLVRLYPKEAARQGLSGRVVMACKVTLQGTLRDCEIVYEDPPGMGFGEATLAAAPLFRMKPAISEGVPVDGRSVRIPISFSLR